MRALRSLFAGLLLAFAGVGAASAQLVSAAAPIGYPYTLLGKITAANMNTTADQAITLDLGGATRYAITATATSGTAVVAILTNCSAAASTAAGGIYTATSKGGTTLTTTTAFANLSGAAGDLQRIVATGAAQTKANTNNPLYFSLTTPQGVACTCDLYVYGMVLP